LPEFTDPYNDPYYGQMENWNTSQVTNMAYLFQNKSYFNRDISKWDTSNVNTMEHMFDGASEFNREIRNWNINSIINNPETNSLNEMFKDASNFNIEYNGDPGYPLDNVETGTPTTDFWIDYQKSNP